MSAFNTTNTNSEEIIGALLPGFVSSLHSSSVLVPVVITGESPTGTYIAKNFITDVWSFGKIVKGVFFEIHQDVSKVLYHPESYKRLLGCHIEGFLGGNQIVRVTLEDSAPGNRWIALTEHGLRYVGIILDDRFYSNEPLNVSLQKPFKQTSKKDHENTIGDDLIGKTIMGKLNATGDIFPVYILNRINDTNYTVLYKDVQIVGVIENMFFTAVGANLQKPVTKKIPFESGVTIIIKTKFFEDVVAKAKSLKQKADNLKSLLNLEEKAEKQSADLKAMVQTKQSGDGSRLTIDIDGKALAILLEKSFEIVSIYADGLLTLARLGVFKLLKEQVNDCAHDLKVRMKEMKD